MGGQVRGGIWSHLGRAEWKWGLGLLSQKAAAWTWSLGPQRGEAAEAGKQTAGKKVTTTEATRNKEPRKA